MRHALQAVGLIGLVIAASLGTAGAASASTSTESASAARPDCSTNMKSRAVSNNWIPRSPEENDRRLSWDQVRNFDRDRDNRLSDREMNEFRNADIPVPNGGPRCDRSDNPKRR